MMALVRGDNASGRRDGSSVKVRGSTSMNTGRAPLNSMAAAVATAVCDTVMTSSPGLISWAFSAKSRASVPEATPTTRLLLQNPANKVQPFDCGHWIMIDKADEFNASVAKWLSA